MDELIWKYLDNQCTEDESEMVKKALIEQPDFVEKYNEIVAINDQLSAVAKFEMRDQFKLALHHKISKTIAAENLKTTDILPLKWMLVLVVAGIAAVIFALAGSDSEQLINISLDIDEKVVSMTAWTVFGILLLFLLDSIYEKLSFFRKIIDLSF